MHGLNTIKRLNKTEQDFVDHVLSSPRPPEQNLLEVWTKWKQETQANEPVSLPVN